MSDTENEIQKAIASDYEDDEVDDEMDNDYTPEEEPKKKKKVQNVVQPKKKSRKREVKGDWNDDKIYKLISIVEQRPQLWDTSLATHRVPKPQVYSLSTYCYRLDN